MGKRIASLETVAKVAAVIDRQSEHVHTCTRDSVQNRPQYQLALPPTQG